MAKSTNVEFLLKNIRFSYLYAFQPYKGENGDSYCSHFIMSPDHPQMAEVKAAILSVAKAAWPADWQEIVTELKAKNRLCLHDGAEKASADGYKGMKYISGSKKTRFTVVETRGGVNVQLTQADGRPLSGDYGNAKVQFWAQDGKYGKRINCDIQGIQYTRKGTPLGGGGRVASVDEFGIEASDADGDAPAAAASSGTDNSDLLG